MTKLFLFPFGLLSLILAGCQNNPSPDLPPKACFNAPSTAIRNEMINFDGTCSENGNSYLWDFGDGETSDQQNPTHAFKVNGEYQVKLLIARNDKKDSVVHKIVVNLSDAEIKCKPVYTLGADIWPAVENDSVAFSYIGDKLNDIKWYNLSISKFHDLRMMCDYDANGRLSKFNFLNVIALNPIQEKLLSTMFIKHNSNDQPSRIDWVNVQGDSIKTWQYTYDDLGRLSQIVNRIVNDKYLRQYQFDANGNNLKTNYTFEFLGNFVGHENKAFDSSLPFYAASKELKIFFENILQIEPSRNNPKTTQLFESVDTGGNITYRGDGPYPSKVGIELQHESKLNEKGLTTEFRVKNFLLSGVYYRKVGYDCD